MTKDATRILMLFILFILVDICFSGNPSVSPLWLYSLIYPAQLWVPHKIPLSLLWLMGLFTDLALHRPLGIGWVEIVVLKALIDLQKNLGLFSSSRSFLREWIGAGITLGALIFVEWGYAKMCALSIFELKNAEKWLILTATYPITALLWRWSTHVRS